jgi:hypothetical protein
MENMNHLLKIPLKFNTLFLLVSAVSKESDLQVLEGTIEIGSQYHFYLEPVACIVRPIEDDQVICLSKVGGRQSLSGGTPACLVSQSFEMLYTMKPL